MAAERAWVALWLWSMRVILRKPEALESFNVRALCPTIPLFANMWIVQLNYWYGTDEINHIIDSIQADGIFLHVNPLQEVVQPEWDLNFEGLISKLTDIVPKLHAPVIIKEVGNGIDKTTAQKLYDIGVQRIDVSGLGGTSRPAVEWYRRQDRLARAVKKLGIQTDEAIKQCASIQWLKIIAGWWLRSWVDVAKAMYLWSDIGTAAQPFLDPALESAEAVYEELMLRKKEFQIALFSTGISKVEQLRENI
jgi:isopentenyl-diphosphate delta-isomerase